MYQQISCARNERQRLSCKQRHKQALRAGSKTWTNSTNHPIKPSCYIKYVITYCMSNCYTSACSTSCSYKSLYAYRSIAWTVISIKFYTLKKTDLEEIFRYKISVFFVVTSIKISSQAHVWSKRCNGYHILFTTFLGRNACRYSGRCNTLVFQQSSWYNIS